MTKGKDHEEMARLLDPQTWHYARKSPVLNDKGSKHGAHGWSLDISFLTHTGMGLILPEL